MSRNNNRQQQQAPPPPRPAVAATGNTNTNGGSAPVVPTAGTSASPAPCENAGSAPPAATAGNEAFPLLGPVAEHPWPPLSMVFPPSRAGTIWMEAMDVAPVVAAVLVVIRPLASGKHVLCSYGDRKDWVCDVRDASLFRKGMEIRGAVPRPKLSERAWYYGGKLPRRPGKW